MVNNAWIMIIDINWLNNYNGYLLVISGYQWLITMTGYEWIYQNCNRLRGCQIKIPFISSRKQRLQQPQQEQPQQQQKHLKQDKPTTRTTTTTTTVTRRERLRTTRNTNVEVELTSRQLLHPSPGLEITRPKDPVGFILRHHWSCP